MCLRRGAVRDKHKVVSFTLDLLVLTRMKTKKDREKMRAVIKKKDQRRCQLGIYGVKLVEDHLTVIQVLLMGPVARRTSQYGIVQNIVIDKTTFANFLIQPPQDPTNKSRVSYDYVREMCMKAAFGKGGYYSKDIFLVGVNSKLYIKSNGVSNNVQECGPTTKEMWLAFNAKRASRRHMNIKVCLCLGYKQRKTNPADSNEYSQGVLLEEPRVLENKSNANSRAASQHVPSGVNAFVDKIYATPESPCFHALSEEMYQTCLIFYAVEEYEGASNTNYIFLVSL